MAAVHSSLAGRVVSVIVSVPVSPTLVQLLVMVTV
jgi:hypothetical protein